MKRRKPNVEKVTLVNAREISEDDLQQFKGQSDDMRAEAVEALKKSNGGFALFYLTKRRGRTGVGTIMAGEMNIKDTVRLLSAIHETCDSVINSVEEQFDAVHKGGDHGKSEEE